VPPAGFARPTWDAASLVGKDAHWGDYAELAALAPEQRALMDRAAAIVFRRLDRFGKGPDRFGLTHGDLMPDNVLVHRGTPSVIDFDDSGFSWFLYDLGTAVSFIEHYPQVPDMVDSWVRGYRQVRDLPAADEHEIWRSLYTRMAMLLPGRAADEVRTGSA